MHRLILTCAAAAAALASPAQSQGYAGPSIAYYHQVYVSTPTSYYPGYAPWYPLAYSYYPGFYGGALLSPYAYAVPYVYPYSLTPIFQFYHPATPFLAWTFDPLPLRYQVPGGRSRVIGGTSGDLVSEAKRQIQVTSEDDEAYRVRWTGPREAVTRVELEAIGVGGKALDSLVLTGAPYAGPLRVPADATAVILSVRNRDGSSAGVKLPVEQFRALAPRREREDARGATRTG
ncbi:MAG: hypothetical protein ACK47B_20990 [Armatimonadota bacterium]